MTEVCIIGIGIHKFGRTDGMSGRQQGAYAVRQALKDCGLEWEDMQFAFGGSAAAGNADSLVNELGLTGIQFVNVSNGCATGGSALLSAYTAIKAGQYDVGVAVGFDKHPRGAFNADPKASGLETWYGETGLMLTTQFFGMKIQKYLHDHNLSPEVLGLVAQKAFRNGAKNPNAWRRDEVDLDTIMNSDMLSNPLTKYMFCSPAEGGVALILASEKAARRFTNRPVFLKAVTMKTRHYGSFEVFSPYQALQQAPAPTVFAAKAAFEMAGLGPEDVGVIQIQDTESGAEVMHMAENGFCKDGEQEKLLREGATEINGRMPTNTDGGCIANGEPIGASGLRQVYEVVLQLRGEAGERQVQNNPKTGYTHVYGAPGLSACTVLQN
ncbi:thiolase family protein [Iodidimonas sp. SYSU 1G8]|uniref:thiolase family protein n=1 Tax=Iodidimonas sp. SYSU 1G8 TaxID=3133967 RepID=UPI0031FED9B2